MSLCECGCGQQTTESKVTNANKGTKRGRHNRFIHGHHARRVRKSADQLRWYRHGVRGGRSVQEHVLIAERALGRKLPAGAKVHHADGNRLNNSPSNLVICQSQSYHSLLHARMRVRAAGGDPNTQLICGSCKELLPFDSFSACSYNKATGKQSACRRCQSVGRATA